MLQKSADEKRAYAAKILRADGAVAKALFGAKSTGTVDADVLCEVAVARLDVLEGPSSAVGKALAALELVASAPRFELTASFLSNGQKGSVETSLDAALAKGGAGFEAQVGRIKEGFKM